MRKIKSRKRSRTRKHALSQPVSLTVEALEPRLVLSATGFGFEELHERPEFHARERGEFDAHRPMLTDLHRDSRANERFEYGGDRRDHLLRPDFGSHQDQRENRQHDERADDFFAGNRPQPRFDDRSSRPPTTLGKPEGESTNSMFEPLGNSFGSEPFQGVSSPSFTAVIITLPPPSSSSSRGDIGRPATTLAPPPRSNSFVTSNQPINAAATLPIAGSFTSATSSRTVASEFGNESPSTRFEVTPTNNESASDMRKTSQAGFATFVSLSTSDLASFGNADSESEAFRITVLHRLSESNQWATTVESAKTSPINLLTDRTARLSEEALWASVSEGGFIEIDADADDDTRGSMALAGETDEHTSSQRMSNRTPRDAFWFDFSDSRLDLLLETTDLEELAKQQSDGGEVAGTEEAWLLAEGGMIVLMKAQFSNAVIELDMEEASQLAAGDEAAAGDFEIPMDAGLGVFQAVDVATTLVEQQGDVPLAADPSIVNQGDANIDADEASPSVEQAVHSESGQSESVRAAAMPLLVAIATFYTRGPKNRRHEEATTSKCDITIRRWS